MVVAVHPSPLLSLKIVSGLQAKAATPNTINITANSTGASFKGENHSLMPRPSSYLERFHYIPRVATPGPFLKYYLCSNSFFALVVWHSSALWNQSRAW